MKNPGIARLGATLFSVAMCEIQFPDSLPTRILHPFLETKHLMPVKPLNTLLVIL